MKTPDWSVLLIVDDRLSREKRQILERKAEEIRKLLGNPLLHTIDHGITEEEAIDAVHQHQPLWVLMPWYRALHWRKLKHEDFHPQPIWIGLTSEPILRYELSEPDSPFQISLMDIEHLRDLSADLLPNGGSVPEIATSRYHFSSSVRQSAAGYPRNLELRLRESPSPPPGNVRLRNHLGRISHSLSATEAWLQQNHLLPSDCTAEWILELSSSEVRLSCHVDATPSPLSPPPLDEKKFQEALFSTQFQRSLPLQSLLHSVDLFRLRVSPNRRTWTATSIYRDPIDPSLWDPRALPSFSIELLRRENIIEAFSRLKSQSELLSDPALILSEDTTRLKERLAASEKRIEEMIHGGVRAVSKSSPTSLTPHLEPEGLLDALETQIRETLPQLQQQASRQQRLLQRLQALLTRLNP